MDTSQRINYISFIIIGILFIVIGLALNELDLFATVDSYNTPDNITNWIDFLEPWIRGLPKPWEG